MKLRLGQRVDAEDGEFGELADIVIDPVTKDVTHLIVQPRHRHVQARLVPVWLVAQDDAVDGLAPIQIGLDTDHIRRLDRATFSEFVPLGAPIDLGDEFDVGSEYVVAQPFWSGSIYGAPAMWNGPARVDFDRVPKGECEIGRQSVVIDADGHRVGHVEGLVVNDEHVSAVVVRTGMLGIHHHFVVPIGKVSAVSADQIALNITGRTVAGLPSSGSLIGPGGEDSLPSPLEAQLGTLAHHASTRLHRLHASRRRHHASSPTNA